MNILKQLPSKLADARIQIQSDGCEQLAWHREQAFEVLRHLESADVAVLGGDVFRGEGSIFYHTLDTWHCDHQKGEGWSLYAARSRREAADYINRYPEQGEVAYAIVVQDKPSARDLLFDGGVDAGA